MNTLEALKIIIARSPRAADNALRTIAAIRNNSPVIQARYIQTLQMALADGEATFTPDERAILVEGLDIPDSQTRDFMLRVRLTQDERTILTELSDETGMSMSDYIRHRLFD